MTPEPLAGEAARPQDGTTGRALAPFARAIGAVNRLAMLPSRLALVAASGILAWSVAARYFLKIPTEWQDETAVFLLIGATFFSGGFVQSYRGHVAIEALAGLLSPRVNRWRMVFVELVSLLFCAFFAWKSWTLFHEAKVEGYTSNSTWGPPLWIPYLLMAAGMTLLTVQIGLDFATRVAGRSGPR